MEEYEQALNTLNELILQSNSIVFFGGAGVSTESGIPDFRSGDGLYNAKGGNGIRYRPEEILHIDFFNLHTGDFYNFYWNKMIYTDARPNAAHRALAALERGGRLKAVVTQNIDGLHQRAGSKNVLELHGSVERYSCVSCGKKFILEQVLIFRPRTPRCDNCGGVVKPDVVLYGESLPEDAVSGAINYIQKADMLIVGGTSLSVYPAAGFVRYFGGGAFVIINMAETPFDGRADLVIRGKIGETLANVVD